MPIQYRRELTIEELDEQIAAYEKKYGLSSEDFTERQHDEVGEFDGMEWSFLIECRKVHLERVNMGAEDGAEK